MMSTASEFAAVRQEFDGKRVLVTGGTKSVGQAATERLRGDGARVLTTARKRPDNLADARLFVATDITAAEGCAAVAQAVRERLGGIDIMVHVVGGSSAPAGGFAVLDDAEWHRALDLESVPGGPAGSGALADDAQSRVRRGCSYHPPAQRKGANQ
jgi:NAD(P)-dependent dehydrogenase (short-subunit alcohol dehydrogenase family)